MTVFNSYYLIFFSDIHSWLYEYLVAQLPLSYFVEFSEPYKYYVFPLRMKQRMITFCWYCEVEFYNNPNWQCLQHIVLNVTEGAKEYFCIMLGLTGRTLMWHVITISLNTQCSKSCYRC